MKMSARQTVSFMFVIDGATGLGENDVMGTGDDARWFCRDDEGQYRTADPQRGHAAFPDRAGSGQRSAQSICFGCRRDESDRYAQRLHRLVSRQRRSA